MLLLLILSIIAIIFGYIIYSFIEVKKTEMSKDAKILAIGLMSLPIIAAIVSLIISCF